VQYRLVIHHWAGPELVHVFLAAPPEAGDPRGTRVRLRELRPPGGRRLLGRDVWDPRSYREFQSEVELLLAGYEPVGEYRVCDSWSDYLNPWASPAMNEQVTERMEA
jgi:hypothetical protein